MFRIIFSSFASSFALKPIHRFNVATPICTKLFSTAGEVQFEGFKYIEKPHRAIEIEVTNDLCEDSSEFATKLWQTVSSAKSIGKSSIYLNFPILQSHLIPIAGMYGFKFHNAEGDNAKMVLWLLEGPSKIPIFASHHCGVGCVVMHENNILVVKEKSNSKIVGWKLPGGYVDLGEDFDAAASREVWEETGIKTEYQSVLAFRHSHNIQFGRSDMYFICKLKPLSTDIHVDNEIEDARWMPFEEFKNQTKQEMLQEVIKLIDKNYEGFDEKVLNSIIKTRKPFKCYFTPK